MDRRKALLLAFGITLLVAAASDRAVAQSRTTVAQSKSTWGEPVDLKPLMPPPTRPFLPPNSVLTPGPANSGSTYSSAPVYDGTRDQATPGLRLTIPSR